MKNLPIYEVLDKLQTSLSSSSRLILQAPPGAGKSTVVPISLLEAMASGLPVAVTKVGEMSNVVEHESNGLLFECGDSNAISNALIRLALDKSYRITLGENARAAIIKNYSITNTANEYLAVYEQALNK